MRLGVSPDDLFIGKSGAILLGFPDTTQDADLYLEKNPENGARAVDAACALGFGLTDAEADEVRRGKDFVQLKDGPFDELLLGLPLALDEQVDAVDAAGEDDEEHRDDRVRAANRAGDGIHRFVVVRHRRGRHG